MSDPLRAQASAQAVVDAYLAGLNAGDLDAIVALYAENASVEDPVGSAPHVGHAAIRAFYAKSLATPLTVEREGPVRVAGRECAFAFCVGLTWNGRALKIRPIDTFEFDANGRILRMRAFFGPGNFE